MSINTKNIAGYIVEADKGSLYYQLTVDVENLQFVQFGQQCEQELHLLYHKLEDPNLNDEEKQTLENKIRKIV